MKKKILSFMMLMVLTLSVCMTALAEEKVSNEPVQEHSGTAAALKSYGTIVYQKGQDTVKIDSEDLYMLADQIDQVKLDVTDQLEALNTFFTAGEGDISLTTSEDINVAHAKPYEEDFVDPLDVNFDTLLEGIAVSQSISQDVTAYGYPEGTVLYKNENGLLTIDESDKGAQQIDVTAATEDNLSAGTAAWVNGSLVLGTGKDNKSYYESNKDLKIASGSFTFYGHGSTTTVTLGKKPRVVVLYNCDLSPGWALMQFQIYDSTNNFKYRYMYKVSGNYNVNVFAKDYTSDINLTDTGFTYTQRLGESGDTIFSGAVLSYYVIF